MVAVVVVGMTVGVGMVAVVAVVVQTVMLVSW